METLRNLRKHIDCCFAVWKYPLERLSAIECPSPPPLPPRASRSRLHEDSVEGLSCLNEPDSQTGNGNDTLSNNVRPSVLGSIVVDDSNVRSPSLRKRDAMMRRYNSAFTLPVGNMRVDQNKNNVSGSKDSLIFTDNGYNDESRSAQHTGERPHSNYMSNGMSFNATDDNDTIGHQGLDQFDIVGESYEARYPWQRDISTQCDFPGYRDSLSSCGSGTSDGNSVPSPGASNCMCKTFQDSDSPRSSRRSSADNVARRSPTDNVRRRHLGYRSRRPHSMTSLESGQIPINSDMYRSDTNLNRHQRPHARTSSDPAMLNVLNRKRMPLLVADDPGSVSDLESIMENPADSVFESHRARSLDCETADITANLAHLQSVRDVKLRGRSLSASVNDVAINGLIPTTSVSDSYLNVLPSPRVSPEMFRNVPDVVVNTDRGNDDVESSADRVSPSWNGNYLSVPRKTPRRRSSGGIANVNSGSDESDQEMAPPPAARRGRRAAIVDTKNFGDVSPTNLSPDLSPSNSCDEGETGSNIAGRMRRRRSSLDVAMNVYPGDLLVQEHHKKLIKRNTISDFYAGRNGAITADDSKKQRQPFSLLKLMKARSKESLHLSDVLKELKPSEFKDNHLAAYKNVHWTDLIASSDKQTGEAADGLGISDMERKRRESVWELFKSECVFLIDHLMVLKHCFLEPLKKVQVEGFLMYTEPSEIFSNIDELCYVSYTFCKDFIAILLKDMSGTDFGSTSALIKAFQRFSNHSKDGSVYHIYCLNYSNALSYLEKLRKNDDFCEFEKWCEQDSRCNRLQLVDLLIGPMQHCTKLPLLLQNIQKYTEDPIEKQQIVESIQKVETSLRRLEEKMRWLKNFERVQEIQRHLIWPSISDLDSRAFIPEYLRPKLSRQPCERLLACPSRQLLHEGTITLAESTKSFDGYMFLFDDILLITKTKKPHRKKQSSSDIHNPTGSGDNQMYTVHRQPIALDRLGIHDVPPHEAAANGLKCAFMVVQISRFQQVIDVFTIQAISESVKGMWISQILDAKTNCLARCGGRTNSSKENDDPAASKKGRHGKSLSIDAVFL
ncbi:uncharacterized protein LOC128218214 isoform X3 [Mya arenaria]|uniref:uncharacterized protein LOC128218214 isoform X3 n=1 Tax=Mya arenaria TaxID=6604 RepID=UPI0022E0BB1B|nr:uncharacterized protein LOC128218214 isoform X3 [Mya arenaria]